MPTPLKPLARMTKRWAAPLLAVPLLAVAATQAQAQPPTQISHPAVSVPSQAQPQKGGRVTELSNPTEYALAIKLASPMVVEFQAPWCGPCRLFEPEYKKLAEKHPDVHLFTVNTDNEAMRDIVRSEGINSVPTFVGFDKHGERAGAVPGANASAVEALIQRLK
ncbi:thioredoxin family protein [Streptomyces sp. RK75]|uniref:thioredoxin family protein n=1 Tax=Streptomyces sp. RK75 TaxID=2824895 RepID=UPI001B378619|nr:thioredoxin family protein [Streptomyces sp. RK75]MBQ0867342.1 thioredoxin family protein [Streptomyces sp. RK75]